LASTQATRCAWFGYPRLCWLWKTLNDKFGRDAFEAALEQFREIENDLNE
jgi:hypothetical protein